MSEPILTDVHGYMCYEREGEYWTMLDGEECMVIDLDQLIAEGEAEECTAVLSTASGDIGCPNGWMNRSVVEINNDKALLILQEGITTLLYSRLKLQNNVTRLPL